MSDFSYLSTRQAAEIIGVTDARVRQMLIGGEIHGKKIGVRVWAVSRNEVEKYCSSIVRQKNNGSIKRGRPRKLDIENV